MKPKTAHPNTFVTGGVRKQPQFHRAIKKIQLSVYQASHALKPQKVYSGISISRTVRKQQELPSTTNKISTPVNNKEEPANEMICPTNNNLPVPFIENNQTELPLKKELNNHPLLFLLDEFENNLKTIREFTGNELISLRIDSWETNQQLVQNLSPDLRNNVEKIYTDIHLLNHLVWLSSEFNHNSQNMIDQYTRISGIIADKLTEMIRIISHPV